MAQLKSLSDLPTTAPRSPIPDSLQGKLDETGYSLNRSRSIAQGILEHLIGPQSGSNDASPQQQPVRSMHRDAEDRIQNAHDIEDLLIRIQNALGTST